MIEAQVEKKLAELRKKAALPLAIELWNGKRFPLSDHPSVTLRVSGASVLRDLDGADLGKLGEAYVEGRIDVEGPIDEALRAAEALASSIRATVRSRVSREMRRNRWPAAHRPARPAGMMATA